MSNPQRPLRARKATHVAKRATPPPAPVGDRRKADRARAGLMASAEKQAGLAKMMDKEAANARRLIVRAVDEAGVTQAEVARILGVTDGRVWQILREERQAIELAESHRQLAEAKRASKQEGEA